MPQRGARDKGLDLVFGRKRVVAPAGVRESIWKFGYLLVSVELPQDCDLTYKFNRKEPKIKMQGIHISSPSHFPCHSFASARFLSKSRLELWARVAMANLMHNTFALPSPLSRPHFRHSP